MLRWNIQSLIISLIVVLALTWAFLNVQPLQSFIGSFNNPNGVYELVAITAFVAWLVNEHIL